MSTQPTKEHTTNATTAKAVDLKLDVVVIPVADVDRAKRFYESLEWRLDADFARARTGAWCGRHLGLGVLRHVRQGVYDRGTRVGAGNVPRRR